MVPTRRLLVLVLVANVAVGGTAVARRVTRAPELAVLIPPLPPTAPLLHTVTVPPGAGGRPGFTLSLPYAPTYVRTARDTGTTELTAPLDATGNASLLVRRYGPRGRDPLASLAIDQFETTGRKRPTDLRRTTFAGLPAAAMSRSAGDRVVFEIRFVHGDDMYGFTQVFARPVDTVALMTGVEVGETWRWATP